MVYLGNPSVNTQFNLKPVERLQLGARPVFTSHLPGGAQSVRPDSIPA